MVVSYFLPPYDKCTWIFMIQILKEEKKAFTVDKVLHTPTRPYNELRITNILKSVGYSELLNSCLPN